MNIIFYNHGHNGDIHVSRELVRYVVENVPTESVTYWHQNSKRLLADQPKLGFEKRMMLPKEYNDQPYVCINESTIAFNTWYAPSPVFASKVVGGCTLNTLYGLFQANLKLIGHDLTAPIESFIPKIDFSCYETAGVRQFFKSVEGRYKRTVLVANAQPKSGQSRVRPRTLVDALAPESYPDTLFLVTNKETPLRKPAPNVVYTADFIGLPEGENDLNENAYVSTFCDTIIGLGSGAYTFAYIVENFLNPKKTMLCFTDFSGIATWVFPASLVKARIITPKVETLGDVFAAIDDVLG